MFTELLSRFECADMILVTFRASSCSECSDLRFSVRMVIVFIIVPQLLLVYCVGISCVFIVTARNERLISFKVVAGFNSDELGRVHPDDVEKVRSAGTVVGLIRRVDVLHVIGQSYEPLGALPTCPVHPCLLESGPKMSGTTAQSPTHTNVSGSTSSLSQK